MIAQINSYRQGLQWQEYNKAFKTFEEMKKGWAFSQCLSENHIQALMRVLWTYDQLSIGPCKTYQVPCLDTNDWINPIRIINTFPLIVLLHSKKIQQIYLFSHIVLLLKVPLPIYCGPKTHLYNHTHTSRGESWYEVIMVDVIWSIVAFYVRLSKSPIMCPSHALSVIHPTWFILFTKLWHASMEQLAFAIIIGGCYDHGL